MLRALSLVTLLILIFFTWRYVKVEYEITVHMGQFNVAVIYGGLTRKELFNCRVKDLTAVAPYETEEQKAEADGFAADRRLVMVSGTDEGDGGDKRSGMQFTRRRTGRRRFWCLTQRRS